MSPQHSRRGRMVQRHQPRRLVHRHRIRKDAPIAELALVFQGRTLGSSLPTGTAPTWQPPSEGPTVSVDFKLIGRKSRPPSSSRSWTTWRRPWRRPPMSGSPAYPLCARIDRSGRPAGCQGAVQQCGVSLDRLREMARQPADDHQSRATVDRAAAAAPATIAPAAAADLTAATDLAPDGGLDPAPVLAPHWPLRRTPI